MKEETKKGLNHRDFLFPYRFIISFCIFTGN